MCVCVCDAPFDAPSYYAPGLHRYSREREVLPQKGSAKEYKEVRYFNVTTGACDMLIDLELSIYLFPFLSYTQMRE